MRFLLLALMLASPAFAANRECAKSCDELVKNMAVQCRRAEKNEAKGSGHGDGDLCQANMKKVRLACNKSCQAESAKKK
ncbi:MAG: hypothetical protein GQE15_17230 [Archangiaceae bacterium]|nr:hypothetical protein [Archangiaceae bacterium]